MRIPVLIEPIAGGGYRARTGEPFGLTVEGMEKAEALLKLEGLITASLRQGAEIVCLEVASVHPVALNGGTLKNDPLFDEWRKIMAENRSREDAAAP